MVLCKGALLGMCLAMVCIVCYVTHDAHHSHTHPQTTYSYTKRYAATTPCKPFGAGMIFFLILAHPVYKM